MKKLGLSKETLRVLEDGVLSEVVGAQPTKPKTGNRTQCKRNKRTRTPGCPGR